MTLTPTIVDAVPASIPAQRGGDPAATWPLVQRAQAGDRDALGDLYRIYHPTIVVFVRRRAYGDMDLADDIAAEVWVRAMRRIGSLRWQGCDFGAWLVTIAKNLLADHYKKAETQRAIRVPPADAALVEALDPHRFEAHVEMAAQYRASLRTAIEQLTPDQREAVRLRFLVGLDTAETAAAMGINAGAVKALTYRAVRALARNLPATVTR